MKNNNNSTIEEFSRKYLSPSAEEQSAISSRYIELQGLLPGSEIFQSGSYPRKTAVTPVHDLDIIWVMPNEWQSRVTKAFSDFENKDDFTFDVSQPLIELAQYLRNEYKKIGVKVVIDDNQRHAVKITFPDENNSSKSFTIDVVPAVKSGQKRSGHDIYLVPEIQKADHDRWKKIYEKREGKVHWILSDPKFYLKQADHINKLNNSYRKAVKFVKTWRRACNSGLTDFELQSFHLEQILANIFLENTSIDTIDAIKTFFTNLPYWLSAPKIADAANPNTFIDSYLDKDVGSGEREKVLTFSAKSLSILNKIGNDSTFSDVYDIFRLLIIAPQPWNQHPEELVKVDVHCQVEKLDKWTNPKGYKHRRSTLPKETVNRMNDRKSLYSGQEIKPGYELVFTPLLTSIIDFDEIKWLVVNTGTDALEKKRVIGWRGFEFNDCDQDTISKTEQTEYIGEHWVECYVIKNGYCIGVGRFDVNIVN